MKWQDHGIILTARRFGEDSLIVNVLTVERGRHAGLIKIAKKGHDRLVIQPGNKVTACWNARLSDHLGRWTLETEQISSAHLLHHPQRLMTLSAACTLTDMCLPERHPYPNLYQGLDSLIQSILDGLSWVTDYIRYEIVLLQQLGFGLDLSCCTATGIKEDLVYVSPKSGRAISRTAGQPYHDRLLALPEFLWQQKTTSHPPLSQLLQGFALTGYFLNHYLLQNQNIELPAARSRLIELLSKEGR